MAESWLDLTDDERSEKIYNLAKNKTGITNFNKYGVLLGFLNVLIIVVNIIFFTLIYLLTQTNLNTATGLFLDLWGLLIGEKRFPAVKAQRKFIGVPYSSGKITAGNWIIIAGTELRYKVLEDIIFDGNNEFEIIVEAEFEGTGYNISDNYEIRFTKVISGLDNVYIPEGEQYLLISGQNEEEDEDFRERCKNKWLSLGAESPRAKYIYIAKSVNGVDDVKIIRCPRGSGSIDVVIACGTGTDPDTIKINVENAINEKIGVARDIRVIFAIEVLVNLHVAFQGTATEDEVRLECENFFEKKQISVSKDIASLYFEIKKNLPDKITSLLISPNADFIVSEYEILIFDDDSFITKV